MVLWCEYDNQTNSNMQSNEWMKHNTSSFIEFKAEKIKSIMNGSMFVIENQMWGKKIKWMKLNERTNKWNEMSEIWMPKALVGSVQTQPCTKKNKKKITESQYRQRRLIINPFISQCLYVNTLNTIQNFFTFIVQ